jgi:uncharacterized OB-fold protein
VSEPVLGIVTPVRVEYNYTAGRARTRFLRGLQQRRFMGQRCPSCQNVYMPPGGSCSLCGLPTEEEVEVGPRGTVTMFCVVNLPFYGQEIQPPYVCASIQLDGSDTKLFHLIQELPAHEVRMGMRVEPVWVEGEPEPSMGSVKYFRPTGEPDVLVDARSASHA